MDELDRVEDRGEQVPDVRDVLPRGIGVPVALDDHALGPIGVEVQVVLKRPGLVRTDEVDGLLGQAEILVASAFDESEASDPQELGPGLEL